MLLADRPGSLAELGEVLGDAGVSLEGGGVFTHRGEAIAHFLVDDAERGRAALDAAGVGPVTIHDVVTTRLDQEVPGQWGRSRARSPGPGSASWSSTATMITGSCWSSLRAGWPSVDGSRRAGAHSDNNQGGRRRLRRYTGARS